jgi:predicted RNA-binding Zn-ribbon protein involved in translation (DUF1610 family)
LTLSQSGRSVTFLPRRFACPGVGALRTRARSTGSRVLAAWYACSVVGYVSPSSTMGGPTQKFDKNANPFRKCVIGVSGFIPATLTARDVASRSKKKRRCRRENAGQTKLEDVGFRHDRDRQNLP